MFSDNNFEFQNLNHRENSSKVKNLIDTFEMTEVEFNELPLKEKFVAMYNQKYLDTNIHVNAHFIGWLLYLFVSTSQMYLWFNYVAPFMIYGITNDKTKIQNDDNLWKLYLLKCLAGYLYYMATVNWLFVLVYKNYWEPDTEDHPELFDKTLWEDYDKSLELRNPKREVDPNQKKPKHGSLRMIDYVPDQNTGMRWRYCVICQLDAPPRTHHCVICNRCILKRDHHCFMTGRCIGFNNQRYFLLFCLFAAIISALGFYSELRFIIESHPGGLDSWWSNLFLPLSLYRWLWTHEISSLYMVIIIHLFIFPLFGGMCLGFTFIQILAISKGVTSDELRQTHNVKSVASIGERWREVFGEYWLMNLVLPTNLILRQTCDGVVWPNLRNLDGLHTLRNISVIKQH